jgi:hypothetical protein
MLLIYCITSININVLVKFNPDIHVIKQNYDIGNPGVIDQSITIMLFARNVPVYMMT